MQVYHIPRPASAAIQCFPSPRCLFCSVHYSALGTLHYTMALPSVGHDTTIKEIGRLAVPGEGNGD